MEFRVLRTTRERVLSTRSTGSPIRACQHFAPLRCCFTSVVNAIARKTSLVLDSFLRYYRAPAHLWPLKINESPTPPAPQELVRLIIQSRKRHTILGVQSIRLIKSLYGEKRDVGNYNSSYVHVICNSALLLPMLRSNVEVTKKYLICKSGFYASLE